jgi:hypothetical protein
MHRKGSRSAYPREAWRCWEPVRVLRITRGRLHELNSLNVLWELATPLDRSLRLWAMSLRLRRGPTNRTGSYLDSGGVWSPARTI